MGNLITTIIVSGKIKYQATEFLVFTFLMVLDIVVFIILAYAYQHLNIPEVISATNIIEISKSSVKE